MPLPPKHILLVAVDDPAGDPTTWDANRPLIRDLKNKVRQLCNGIYNEQYTYAIDALGPSATNSADNGKIQDKIRRQLKQQMADVIMPIASAATKAAKAVVDQDYSANRIPIVFTVVSRPIEEGIMDGTPRITGVSRNLVDTASLAVDKFAACFNGPCDIYWWTRPIPQNQLATCNITDSSHSNVTLYPIPLQPNANRMYDCGSLLQFVKGIPRGAGLFMIPDDLVGECAGAVIRQARSQGVPTFFQQLEWVCPAGRSGAFAPAGYGVPTGWVGAKAAEYIFQALQNANNATSTNLPFLKPSADELQFKVNTSEAKHLGLKESPQGSTSCAGNRAAPRPAARQKAVPKPAAKGPTRTKATTRKATAVRTARTKRRAAKPPRKTAGAAKRPARRRTKK